MRRGAGVPPATGRCNRANMQGLNCGTRRMGPAPAKGLPPSPTSPIFSGCHNLGSGTGQGSTRFFASCGRDLTQLMRCSCSIC